MNFMSTQVRSHAAGELQLSLPDDSVLRLPCQQMVAAGTPLVLGVRPEHLHVTTGSGSGLQGEVVVAERLGGETFFHVRVSDKTVIAKADGECSIQVGERVSMRFDTSQAHVFVPDGPRLS
jgi:multiple sugar transport system ATP-binding protein